jgi:cholesterol transport system auxiliary component
MTMNLRPFLSPPVLALALAGCVNIGGKPPASLLTLNPQESAPAGPAQVVKDGEAVTVLAPRAVQMLNVQRVPVVTGSSSVAYLKGALWADVPSRLFRDLLAETIGARTGRPVLDIRQYTLSPGIRLTGTLDHFELDARTHQAVVVYDATLARGGTAPVETRRFAARAPAASERPESVAAAIGVAANQVAGEVADWIGK